MPLNQLSLVRKSLLLLALMATLLLIEASLDETVTECVAQSKLFAAIEPIYIRERELARTEPSPVSPPDPYFVHRVYEREKRQRPFECITERSAASAMELASSKEYQELVSWCEATHDHPDCNASYPHRTFDGSCNNLLHYRWGSSLACMRRLFDAHYEGVAGFRESVCGGELPPPRTLSLAIHKDVDRPTTKTTHMLPFFGQFVAHDVSDGPLTTIDGKRIECCRYPKSPLQHPQCAEILLSPDDPFFSMFNITCINIFRLAICDKCSVGKRDGFNQATSFVDLSLTYGYSDFGTNDLIARDGTGKLQVQEFEDSRDLMPRQKDRASRCGDVQKGEYCFRGGDRRVDQHTPVMSLHTVFVREHNRIADGLKSMNPQWDEQKLFQEARKINIAQYQHITYREFLPSLLGPALVDQYGLRASEQGHTQYDPTVDPTLLAEFSVAAFRLETLVNSQVTQEQACPKRRLFRDMFIEPGPLYHGCLAPLMEGVSRSPSQEYDRFVVTDLTDFLYKRPTGNYGFDVASFNIMRGRDAGLPTYVQTVQQLSNGSVQIDSFDGLQIFMDEENMADLRKLYCDVRDIDLWVGMNNERPSSAESVVGPTAARIIAFQFNQLKYGDRFYFEHQGNFNQAQLASIRQTSLSGVLCSTTDISAMQPRAMEVPSATNKIHPCDDIPKIDLSLWKG